MSIEQISLGDPNPVINPKGLIRRGELFATLRTVADGGESPFTISPIDLYRYRLISRARLFKQTTSLAGFLGANNMPLSEKLYPQFYQTLSERIPSGVLMVRGRNRMQYHYRVYNPIAALQMELVTSLVEGVKTATHPTRSPDEMRCYQEKVLRKRSSQGVLTPISIEDALDELDRRTRGFARYLQSGEDSLDIASSTVEDMLPCLQGEKEEFEHFGHFINYAMMAVRNRFYNQLIKNKRELKAQQEAFRAAKLGEGEDNQENDAASQNNEAGKLSDLPPEHVHILRLYSMGIHYKGLEQITGINATTLRYWAMAARDHINPDRARVQRSPCFDLDIALSDYQRIRTATLAVRERLPTSYDLKMAFRRGEVTYEEASYRRLGGVWSRAQEILERMVRAKVFERTITFVKQAIKEGAHQKKSSMISDENWTRAKNILGLYLWTRASEPEILRIYPCGFQTRERVRKIIEHCVKSLWENVSDKTQQDFPLSELSLRKPYDFYAKKDILPQREQKPKGNITEALRKARTNEDIKDALNMVTRKKYYGLIDKQLIVPVEEAAIGYRYQRHVGLFIQTLEESGIQVGKVMQVQKYKSGFEKIGTYYFIRAADLWRARAALQRSKSVQHLHKNLGRQPNN